MRERIILHSDLNNFYATVECIQNPELANSPLVVGGDEDARCGIVLAKNNLAKSFGVRTGEVLWQARAKCPNLVVVPARHHLYDQYSRRVREIYDQYTDRIEGFGIDECWLDISGTGIDGPAVADQIRQQVRAQTGCTVSIGVSFNKIFAKLGSDLRKPDATTVISRDNYRQIVWPLAVSELLFVGRATTQTLAKIGIMTIGDLARCPVDLLVEKLGKVGAQLSTYARGEDTSPVISNDERDVVKSIGNSQTTPRDMVNRSEVLAMVTHIAESVVSRMREQGLQGQTVGIVLRDTALKDYVRQVHLPVPTMVSQTVIDAAMSLVDQFPMRPLRMVGVRITDLSPASAPSQIHLLIDDTRNEQLERAVERIRHRYGRAAIRRGVEFNHDDLIRDPDSE